MGLSYDPEALQAIRLLPSTAKKAIRSALDALAKDAPGLDIRRLDTDQGPPVFRVRVGHYRIAFLRFPGEARVLRVFHRREGYGWLERFG